MPRPAFVGWAEVYLNGKKIDNRVLDPVVTQYDRRVRYVRCDVTKLLKKGENVFGVILGNGWYHCSTADVWHFDKAPWLDYPKFIFELTIAGKAVLRSDESWKCLKGNGPIRFNELRNGEFYDARRELQGWVEAGFDDSTWDNARIVQGPGGILTEQTMPPCKVMRRLKTKKVHFFPDGGGIHDTTQNITGWAHIRVRGEAGAAITLRYAGHLNESRDHVDQTNISAFIKSGEVQTDRYILKGGKIEDWEPRFTYHGFRYVEVSVSGKAEVLDLQGCLVHTSFNSLAEFETSDPMLNKLYQCIRWSFVNNFTGIPTDCPHREKNGWTGDALCAAETGLFHFDMAASYHDWLQTAADVQRPNGQLPGIVPSDGWGFNWGSGPAWDSAFILIPWYVYIYTGKTRIIEENYEGMKRYIGYLDTLATDYLVAFGLGDWAHADMNRICDTRITSTGYYYADTVVMEKCAELLGNTKDAKIFHALAKQIAQSFNKTFYNGDGTYGNGETTALACALHQGLCPAEETAKTAAKLNSLVEVNRCRADFGILGAKYTPRALAEHGYAQTAFRLIVQKDFPGWMNWINQGATTLWETWQGGASQNHIMFGDIAAWMMQYLAGIVPDEKHPGFSALTIRPFAPEELNSLRASCRTPHGVVRVKWRKVHGVFRLEVAIPEGIPCRVLLPGGVIRQQTEPKANYQCECWI